MFRTLYNYQHIGHNVFRRRGGGRTREQWKEEENSNVLIGRKSSFLQLTINEWRRLRNDCVIPTNIKIFVHKIDNKQPNCTERLHVDATKMRYFHTEQFSSFMPSTYADHVNFAAAKPCQFMPNWKDGNTA